MDAETPKELSPEADFRDVIGLWPSRAALAADLDVEHWLVEAWYRKRSIPPRWFDSVTRAAIKRDFLGVSSEVLLRLHVRRVEGGRPARAKKNDSTDVPA